MSVGEIRARGKNEETCEARSWPRAVRKWIKAGINRYDVTAVATRAPGSIVISRLLHPGEGAFFRPRQVTLRCAQTRLLIRSPAFNKNRHPIAALGG